MLLLRAAPSIFFVEGPTLPTSPDVAKSQEVVAPLHGGVSRVLVQVTGHHMIGRDLFGYRFDLSALRLGKRTARVEAAAGGRVNRRRHFPGQDHLLAHDVRVARQGRGEERLRIGG